MAWFQHNPLAFARYAYPWGSGELADANSPRDWQTAILRDIGAHLSDPVTRFQPLRIAVASGHGIGKSALISMVTDWAMSTCEDCRVVVTANTDTQLRTKTWPEVGKWFRLSINAHWFNVTATAVASVDPEHARSWKADAVPWSDHNTEAFAGLHNKNKRIVLIFDEASSISDRVWEVAEGALTDENTEIIWLAFGNPTRNTGRFRECFRKFRHRWRHYQIDSRTVEGTNTAEIAKLAEDYGEDSDFFKVRVRGMFPAMSSKQFISTTDVDEAYGREYQAAQYIFAPKILTCDPAWEGDDALVIALRQGLVFQILRVIPKNDNDIHVAKLISQLEDQHEADAVFVDAGYGTGIISAGRTIGKNWQVVWFAGASLDAGCLNKRAEMWKNMRDWLKDGGAIPNDQGLYDELISSETVPRTDGKIQLESKADMKKCGLPSPNKADALALSFAFHVTKKTHRNIGAHDSAAREYNPYA